MAASDTFGLLERYGRDVASALVISGEEPTSRPALDSHPQGRRSCRPGLIQAEAECLRLARAIGLTSIDPTLETTGEQDDNNHIYLIHWLHDALERH
jgi:hypothetical protein